MTEANNVLVRRNISPRYHAFAPRCLDRRTFLQTLCAVGVLPVTARAWSTGTQLRPDGLLVGVEGAVNKDWQSISWNEEYVVTSLEDNAKKPGTLRYLIETRNAQAASAKRPPLNPSLLPRPVHVTFAVEGRIRLYEDLDIRYGHMFLDGSTAPGRGICITDKHVYFQSDSRDFPVSHVILHHLRFRLWPFTRTTTPIIPKDELCNTDEQGTLSLLGCRNVLIDHCSISWATDQCLSIQSQTFGESAPSHYLASEHVTVQWSIISEPLKWYKSAGTLGDGGTGLV